MSNYSDEDEGIPYRSPELLDVQVTGKVDVAHISDAVVSEIKKEMAKRIAKEAASAVEEALNEGVKEQALKAVEGVLANGWQVSRGDYAPVMVTVTLKEKVMELLAKRGEYGRGNVLEEMLKEKLNHEVRKMVQEEIEKVRTAFRAQIDATLQSRFLDTLRNALGIK